MPPPELSWSLVCRTGTPSQSRMTISMYTDQITSGEYYLTVNPWLSPCQGLNWNFTSSPSPLFSYLRAISRPFSLEHGKGSFNWSIMTMKMDLSTMETKRTAFVQFFQDFRQGWVCKVVLWPYKTGVQSHLAWLSDGWTWKVTVKGGEEGNLLISWYRFSKSGREKEWAREKVSGTGRFTLALVLWRGCFLPGMYLLSGQQEL